MRNAGSHETIFVWDIFVRFFHWSTVTAFLLAYLTAEEWMAAHRLLGYALTILVMLRLIWGVVGPRHARFSSFLTSPANTVQYLKDLVRGSAARFIGHNPAGAWMIIALLVCLLATSFSGMLMIAPAGKGPLAHTFIASLGGRWLEEIHEAFANMTVALAFLHVAGVMLSSWLHHENLVRAMVTGYKQAKP